MGSRTGFVPLILAAIFAVGCGGSLRPHTIAIQTTPREAVAAGRVLVVLDPASLDEFSRSVLTRVIRLEDAPADTTTFLRAFAGGLEDAFATVGVDGRVQVGKHVDPAYPADLVVFVEHVRAYGDMDPAGKASARVYRLDTIDLEARVPPRARGAQPAWWAYVQAQPGEDTIESLGRGVAARLVASMWHDGMFRASGE